MHMEFLKVLTHDQKLKAVYKKLPNLGLLLVESRQQNSFNLLKMDALCVI